MRKTESSDSPEQRASLHDRLIGQALFLQSNFAYMQRDFAPQLEVLTIMTILQMRDTDPLTKAEESKLKRMLGLQMKNTPESVAGPRDREFWAMVHEAAGREITQAAGLAEDLSDLPRSWQPAFEDLHELQVIIA